MTNLSFTDQRGQAITEFAIFLPIYLLLIFGLIFFAKAYYIQQQTISAARYAAWQKGDFNTDDNELTEQVKKYFFRRLNADRVEVKPETSSQTYDSMMNEGRGKAGESGGGGLMETAMSALMGVMDTLSNTRGYHVSYDLEVLPFLKPILGDRTKIGAVCHVDKNTWCWNNGIHGFWDALWQMIKSLAGGIADIFS